MHHHNFYYGQAHILAEYAGVNSMYPPRMRGYLQHGWNIACGWNPQHEFFDGAWRYVWSDAPLRRGYQLGRRNYHIIGAPWLYLLELDAAQRAAAATPAPQVEREGTLWFLFHGWEGGKIEGDHRRLIDEIREVEQGPVTFSLYYTEYERPEIRRQYLDAGFDIISFGKRGWNYEGQDTLFLHKQLAAMRRHKRVASNRLSTAVFYGASVGCEIGVYGDPMVLEGEDPLFGGVARVKRLWPQMHGAAVDPAIAREITDHELGVRWLLPPAELKAILFDGVNE